MMSSIKTKKIISKRNIKKGEKELTGSSFHELAIYIFIFIVFAIIYSYSFDQKLSINGDNANYYLLGKSLSKGQGYNLYNDLNARPHNHFPPGYPLIIGFLSIFNSNPLFIKLANGIFLLGCFFLSFKLFRKLQIPWQMALVSVCFMSFNYHLMKSSVTIMSEIPFTFFSLLSLWFLMRINFSKDFLKDKYFYYFLFALSFTFHIRTVGIALLGGTLFYLFLERKWKASLATFVGFVVLGLPWILRAKILGLKSSYQSQLLSINPYQLELGQAGLMDLIERAGNNFVRYITTEIPSGLLPFLEFNYKESPVWSEWMLGGILVLLFIFGIYQLPRYRSVIIGYIGGTFSILMLWPDVWFGIRFLVPLIPILILLVVLSLSWLLMKGSSLLGIKSSYLSFLLLPLICFYTQKYQPNQDYNRQSYPMTRLYIESSGKLNSKWKNYFEIAKYVKANIKNTDIVACRKPQLFHIYSDRFTCRYPYEQDDKKLLETLKEKGVKYVVVDQLGFASTKKYLVPAIRKNPGNFKEILHLKNPSTYLLQFIPSK